MASEQKDTQISNVKNEIEALAKKKQEKQVDPIEVIRAELARLGISDDAAQDSWRSAIIRGSSQDTKTAVTFLCSLGFARIVNVYFLVLLLILPIGLQLADAQTILVQTSKSTYHYGDYLSVTISVSKISGNNAIMHIIDSEGIKRSAIPIQIKNTNTTITTPVPFNVELFREGKYQIQIEYDGVKSSVPFQLVDIGNIVMPFGSNVIIPQWLDGAVTDHMFFKFLVEKNAIKLPEGTKIRRENRDSLLVQDKRQMVD